MSTLPSTFRRIRQSLRLGALLAGALTLAACGVMGNGDLQTESRPETGFTKVENTSSLAVTLRQGSKFSVQVELDSNLLSLIETTVVDGTLRIIEAENIDPKSNGRVTITLPLLAGAVNSGSGDMSISDITASGAVVLQDSGSGSLSFSGKTGAITADAPGSGSMTLVGSGAHISVLASGSGSVHADQFVASGGADVDLTGSGSVDVTAKGDASLSTSGSGSIEATLNGGTATFTASGSGSIRWSGNEKVGSSSVSGSGTVEHE